MRHGRYHDERMASDHDDPDPDDVETLIYGALVLVLVTVALIGVAVYLPRIFPHWTWN